MRSGLWSELNEKAVLSSKNDSDGKTPITLLDSFIEDIF